MKVTAYELKFEPLVLKELLLECDISQTELASVLTATLGRSVSRATVNLCLNRGYLPRKIKGFKKALEKFVETSADTSEWLVQRNLKIADIWEPLGKNLRKELSSRHGKRSEDGRTLRPGGEELEPSLRKWEVEAMRPEVMKHFKLFKDPFNNDVNSSQDIFMSSEHRYIEAVMLDAVYHASFVAIIGEVQSGKSILRIKVMEDLKRDSSVTVIYPRSRRVNMGEDFYSRINPVSLCDAIIMDISSEKPVITTEHKIRQLERLLSSRASQGFKHVIIIEEAQNLTPVTLKYLKQFYELEDGFKKLMGIILIGQPELKEMLDESKHVDMREVIRRIQVAEIGGLGDDLKNYLAFKFKRVGASLDKIFDDDAIEALSRKLTTENIKRQKLSHACPGLVHICVSKAMALACETGEPRVTADVIESI